jgi:outer membrane receptor for ferrienterochelin and colicin
MTGNISIRFITAVLLTLFAFTGSLFAQATGSIAGAVTDTQGAVVRGATVTLTSNATNASQTVTTGDDGLYRFVLLQPGTYTVKSSAASFGDSTLNVEVQVGRTTDANVTLTAGAVAAVVQVSAEGIQATSSTFDAIQNATAIQTLPLNGRRFQDLVGGSPTALVEPSRGQISLSGQRGINSNLTVDGVDYNQPFFGGIRGGERSNSAFTLPLEAIAEFQVIASGYSAEYGRSSGGVVNVATKSGTNDLRGSAFIYWRPEDLALGNEFTDALREQKLNALNIPLIIAPTQTQFGGSVGGPILKNKLFFFTAYEQQKLSVRRAVTHTTLVGLTPTTVTPVQLEPFNTYKAEQTEFNQTNDATAFLGKIDYDINDANRFNVRYNYAKNDAVNGVSTGETALDPTTNRSLGTNGTEGDKNNVIVAQLVSNFSPTVSNDFHFQWAKEDRPRLANVEQVSVVTAIGELGTRSFLPTVQDDTRYQVMDAMTFNTGSHEFKFGGEYSTIAIGQEFGFNQFGNYTFSGLNVTGDILTALSNTPSAGRLGRFDVAQARFNQQIGNLQADFDVKELAFFGLDRWRATQKLTINYGLRYEKQFNPSAQATNTPVINAVKAATFPLLGNQSIDPTQIPDSKNQWGPRLGFAYDLMGNGKTVIRGFSGIYYARTPAIVLAAPFNNFRDPAGDLSIQLGPGAFPGTAPNATTASNFNFTNFFNANPNYAAITGLTAAQCANAGNAFNNGGSQALFNQCAPNTVYRQFALLNLNLNSFGLSTLPSLTGAQLQQISDRLRAATPNSPSPLGFFQQANLIGISPDFQNPMSYQFGGGFEREIYRNFVFGLDFSWVKTIHLQRNVDINLPAPSSFDPDTGRPKYIRNNRPIPTLGSIQLRDSSANSLYRSVTARARINRHWGQVYAYYTWSKNESDDDNERDSGGVLYDDPFTRRGEYYASKLDRTHQFVATPVIFLPAGVEFSSSIRLRSGTPLNPLVGSDLNGDNNSGNERPYLGYGVEFPRNYFRNRPIYDMDVRVQKRISLGETTKLIFSGEIFNILNRANMQLFQGTLSGSPTLYCASTTDTRCGLNGATNVNFLQLYDQRPGSTFGKLNLLNTPGSQPFQVQLGARFQF